MEASPDDVFVSGHAHVWKKGVFLVSLASKSKVERKKDRRGGEQVSSVFQISFRTSVILSQVLSTLSCSSDFQSSSFSGMLSGHRR